jgi:hypothetical protein
MKGDNIMAHNITANDDTIAYGIKKIMVDSKEELKELPYKLAPGSKALDVSTMDLYLLNNQNTWVKIKNLKVSGGSSSEGGSGNGGSGEEGKTYIWDGGDI